MNKIFSYLVGLNWAFVHIKVPHLSCQVVSCQQVAPIVAELNIRNRGNNL